MNEWVRNIRCPQCGMGITGAFLAGDDWPRHRGALPELCTYSETIAEKDFTSEVIPVGE